MSEGGRAPVRDTLGRYEILFRLAAGGMAEVLAACQRGEAGFVRLCAIKRMLPELADDETLVRMFLDEARLAASISSPHVVPTFDAGRDEDGKPYLVMELVVGVTLSELVGDALREGETLPIAAAAEILAQAALGLFDVHESRSATGAPLGIVHRDVSPANVIVGADGRVRVSDFGIAHALERSTKTTTGEMRGRFAYYSPEQASRGPVDSRSDIFSLGVVAWQTFAGKRLFVSSEPLGALQLVLEMPIPPLIEVRPECGRALSDVIARCLERDPARRFQSARELAAALRSAVPASDVELAPLVARFSSRRIERVRARIEASLGDDTVERAPFVEPMLHEKPPLGEEPTMALHRAIDATPVDRATGPTLRTRRPRAQRGLVLAAIVTIALAVAAIGSAIALGGKASSSRSDERARAIGGARLPVARASLDAGAERLATEQPETYGDPRVLRDAGAEADASARLGQRARLRTRKRSSSAVSSGAPLGGLDEFGGGR